MVTESYGARGGRQLKEQGLQSKIIDHLQAEGFIAINIMVTSKSGISDVIACSPTGRFWSIEVKDKDEKPSTLQYDKLEQFGRRNAVSFWTDSWEDYLVKYEQAPVFKSNSLESPITKHPLI